MSVQEYKIVLAGDFGSGRTTFASRVLQAKKDKQDKKAIKTTLFPVKAYTSAGTINLTLYDTLVHAKGGMPDNAFFRTADAAVIFFDLTKEDSYNHVEDWYNEIQQANGRKGSEPLPVIVVGSKADDVKNRDVKPSAIEFPRKKGLPYMEISSKANYNVKELLLEIIKSLVGEGTQFTDNLELDKASSEIDEAAMEKSKKEYDDAAK